MVCVLVQVLWRHAVVLAFDHVAQAAKEAFNHVCVLTVVAVDFGVVHAVNVVAQGRPPKLPKGWYLSFAKFVDSGLACQGGPAKVAQKGEFNATRHEP